MTANFKLGKSQSTCGRWVPKPEAVSKGEEISDETVPIQDQIENLRSKIILRERFNKALKDELEESRQGAATVLQDLYKETVELRRNFIDAVDAEKFAVQNALRTHREFQLALLDKTPAFAIGWLEDKIFDNAKRLNVLMDRLQDKRSKLEEAENMVMVIEKWPRPGTLPWELAANLNFARMENMIEAVDVKRETAQIMNLKYKDIKSTLSEERGRYAPNLRNLETQLNFHKQEIKNLEKMQEDASKFRDEAAKNFALTETEASINRKKRRKQMAKMKKAVQKVMEANQVKTNPQNAQYLKLNYDNTTTEKTLQNDIAERIEAKRAEVEKYQDRARRLVETMRVPDLTFIPKRLITVMELGSRLTAELEAKENLRDLLIRQRNQLMLILCHYKYTGQTQLSEYNKKIQDFETQVEDLRHQLAEKQAKLTLLGNVTADIRLGVIALSERLDESKGSSAGTARQAKVELKMQLRILNSKCKKVLKSVENLRTLFENEETDKNYGAYVKPPPVPPRLIRVGSPVVSEGSDEEDYSDFKVPNRQEIKARSKKCIQQALIRRGLH